MSRLGVSLFEKLEARLQIDSPAACWVWIGDLNENGYGQIRHKQKHLKAHRVAYEMFCGKIAGEMVLHSCDNRKCCNPSHLRIGTHAENMEDRKRRGRNKLFSGEKHGNAVLTEAAVRQLRKSNLGPVELAQAYSVSPRTIRDARNGTTWSHIS